LRVPRTDDLRFPRWWAGGLGAGGVGRERGERCEYYCQNPNQYHLF